MPWLQEPGIRREKTAMDKLLDEVSHEMNGEDLGEVLFALVKGWGRAHPEEELLILSLPREDPQQRIAVMEAALELMRRETERKN